MTDKTLGAYKRTSPDPDETTGEALARLQAEMTRLLDEADAEMRDAADGGVAAALIEEEEGVDAAASRLAAFARKFGIPPEWTTAPAVQAWHRSDHRTEHDGTPGQPRIWSPDYGTTERWSTPSLRDVHWSDLVDVVPLAPVRECPDPEQHRTETHPGGLSASEWKILAETYGRDLDRLRDDAELAEEFAALWKETTREHVGRARTAHSYADAARVAHADVLTRAEKAEQERDEARKFATAEHVRATGAEQERDSWQDIAQQTARSVEALRAESRPLTPDAITDEMVDRYWAAMRNPGSNYDEAVRRALAAALTEPPSRPEGAERFDPIVDAAIRGHSDITSPDVVRAVSDALAEEGLRAPEGSGR